MSKKRYENPPGADIRKMTLPTLRIFFSAMKKINKTIPTLNINWVNGHNLKNQINQLGKTDYITWLGHATFLMQLSGKTLLIDPFFSDKAGPFGIFGFKRFVPPALKITELPIIDYILITHNHYDHLDMPFLKKLHNKSHTIIITPSSLGKFIKKSGFEHIIELAWHETYKTGPLSITALPAYHYSKRGLFDLNKSHWCSFAISSNSHKFFHSGDTAYGPEFKELGKKYGPFDFAMLGIGAYMPIEIMKLVHSNPEEALQTAIDLQARCILPMHWGTVALSSEPIHEPLDKLHEALREKNISDIAIKLTKIGDILAL
jgi:N-acyl-phosphatidylethanolamine-hydrolysing phospholipase D